MDIDDKISGSNCLVLRKFTGLKFKMTCFGGELVTIRHFLGCEWLEQKHPEYTAIIKKQVATWDKKDRSKLMSILEMIKTEI